MAHELRSAAPDLTWHKSSHSNQEGGDCVEVAQGIPGVIPVRDSKAPARAVIPFGTESWTAFVGGLKARRPLP